MLIKAVIQAIPTYAMTCFRIPTTILKDIEKLCANLWWGETDSKKKIHWKNWPSLKHAKDTGGMVFSDMVTFNKALLAKQVWRIISNPESIVAKVLKGRYFRHTGIMEAKVGNNPSFIWRSLLWSREIIEDGILWKISNGRKVSITKDRWIPDRPNGKMISHNSLIRD